MILDGVVRTFLDKIGFSASEPVLGRVGPGLAASQGWLGTGYSPVHLQGTNTAVAATFETVWAGSNVYPWQTADQQPWLQSTDVDDDDPAGNGARTVRVWWLNSAGVEATEDVALNGVGAVQMVASTVRRINRAEVLTCGVTGMNEGTITLYATDAATAIGIIQPPNTAGFLGVGALNGCLQTVPVGKRDVIEQMHACANQNNVRSFLMVRPSPTSPWIPKATVHPPWYHATDVDLPPLIIPAGSDYMVIAAGTVGATTWAALTGWREPV
jgi:hypothetical protein